MPCFDCACKQASMRPRRAAANRDLNTVPTWVDKLHAHSVPDKAGTGVMQAERSVSAEHVAVTAGHFPRVSFDMGMSPHERNAALSGY